MSYTIEYPATDPNRAERALAAAEAYLGDKFPGTIELFTQAITDGEITTRQQVHFGMSFVGIQGYPVEAIIGKYWPSLPAAEMPEAV